MNANKKSLVNNNGWVLCPSKSFSGKMYYFNVQTGEAVWTLGENEKYVSKKDGRNVQKVNSFHNYPEPPTPPDYSPDVTPDNSCQSTSNVCPNHNQTSFQKHYAHYANQPIFGQPPQYVTPSMAPFMPGMPNVVWTPIQLPTPRWSYYPEDKKPTVDRITQTSMLDRELFVQTSGKPLCQRFVNYEIPSLTFNDKNKIINRSSSFVTSTPIKNSNSKMEHSQNLVPNSKFIPEPILNMETESTERPSFFKRSTFDGDMPRKHFVEKPALGIGNMVHNQKPDIGKSPTKYLKDLHHSDLRFLLMAKRKKLEEEERNQIAHKKPKLQVSQTPQKKKVTFNLENLNDSMCMENENSIPSDQTADCKTSFYKITMSPTQTMLNYYNMLEHKIPAQNNMPNHNMPTNNMPTRNILQKDADKIVYAQSCNDKMPKNNFTNNKYAQCDFTIKRRIENYTLTDNMPTDNNLNTSKYISIKDGNQNHFKNATPILLDASAYTPIRNSPIINHTLSSSEYSQNYPTKTFATFKEVATSMPNCNNELSKNMPLCSKELFKNMPDCNSATKDIEKATNSMPNSNMPIKESANMGLVSKELINSYTIKDVWYIVVDSDVLLNDLAIVDQLLMSDEKCKLLIPQCIRKEIESLCIGDCRGQQRVLVARQLSRRMSTPQKQCIVIPPNEEDIELTTTDAILNTCTRFMKDQYYLILITNDADLHTKAKTLSIRCYKPQDIKNGVQTRPILFSELKKIKVIIDNDKNKEKHGVAIKNCDGEKSVSVDMFKKQLFDKQSDKNCDILINITKSKSLVSDSNLTKLKINNLEEISILGDSKTSQDFENGSQTRQQNQNVNPKIYNLKSQFENLEKVVTNSKSDINIQNSDYIENKKNQDTKMSIDSTPNTTINNTKVNDIQNSTLNDKIHMIENFKIPKLLPLQKRTNMSAPNQTSNASEHSDSNFKNSMDGRLKNFFVKSKIMHEKIETRMDEWACTYTQIMEDLLNYILQANPNYKKNNILSSNLQELLKCLKMLYNDEELKNIVELLVDMLDKCSCSKGKIKLDTTPKDFIKIIGCGVLLVEALKTVLPNHILTDYSSYLNELLTNIESKAVELDPELLRSSLESHSDIEDAKETRMNFLKDPTYIIEYLKKHYKEWTSYDQNQDKENGLYTYSPNEDFTIVRMIGKNLNRVKIDNNKCISYAKSSTGKENTNQDDTKVIKLSQNDNHPAKDTTDQRNGTKSILKVNFENQHDSNEKGIKENAGSKIIRLIDNVSHNIEDDYAETNIEFKKEPLDLDILDYETSITADQNSDKIMENINSIIQNNDNSNVTTESLKKENSIFDSKIRICEQIIERNNNYANENDIYAIESDNYATEVIEFDVNAANNDNYAANDNYYANNNLISRDDSTNDSGIENDSTQTQSILKIFLIELSNTFKVIYGFITSFVKEIRGKEISEERKKYLHLKSSRSLQDLVGVTQQLRSIIKREYQGNSRLKRLLHSAGTDVNMDNRIRRYRPIIMKCLAQAEILENSLRSIVAITVGDLDALSNIADSISSCVKYIKK